MTYKIELENFLLKKYSDTNYEDKSVLITLENDPIVMKYIGDLDRILYKIENADNNIDSLYVIRYGNEEYNYPVGITFLNLIDNKIYISLALLKDKRHEYLGELFTQEFTEKLFEITDVDELYLTIENSNVASRKAATSIGFVREGYSTRYKMKR